MQDYDEVPLASSPLPRKQGSGEDSLVKHRDLSRPQSRRPRSTHPSKIGKGRQRVLAFLCLTLCMMSAALFLAAFPAFFTELFGAAFLGVTDRGVDFMAVGLALLPVSLGVDVARLIMMHPHSRYFIGGIVPIVLPFVSLVLVQIGITWIPFRDTSLGNSNEAFIVSCVIATLAGLLAFFAMPQRHKQPQ